MTYYTTMKNVTAWIFGSLERSRLAGAITETRIDLADQIRNAGAQAKQSWQTTADHYLTQAKTYLDAWDIQQGWVSLMCAQRAILSNPKDPDRVRRAAITLRREAEKVTGWRAKVIEDFICGPKGELLDGLADVNGKAIAPGLCKRVIDAVALRDDHANTAYFKILLRRRSLFQLFLVLWLAIAVLILLSVLEKLPEPFGHWNEVVAVVIFGALGAGLSVAQGLLAADVSAKIPSQQIGSFVVWMRPGIGAAAALAAFALVHANATLKVLNETISTNFSVIIVIAFVAGFSERFIVGAVERISQIKSKGKDD